LIQPDDLSSCCRNDKPFDQADQERWPCRRAHFELRQALREGAFLSPDAARPYSEWGLIVPKLGTPQKACYFDKKYDNVLFRGYGHEKEILRKGSINRFGTSSAIPFGIFGLWSRTTKIKFKETAWDFGKVKQGEVVSHEFVFANEGDETLIIQKVSTSCGCTAALVSAEKIPPGKEGRIGVKFDTRGYGGPVKKLVYVDSNDPGDAHRQLEVAADVEVPPSPKIDLDPYNYDAGLIVEGEELKANLKIISKGELELRVEFSHRSATFSIGGKPVTAPLKIAGGKEVAVGSGSPPRAGPESSANTFSSSPTTPCARPCRCT